jgi:hypothetical protein
VSAKLFIAQELVYLPTSIFKRDPARLASVLLAAICDDPMEFAGVALVCYGPIADMAPDNFDVRFA